MKIEQGELQVVALDKDGFELSSQFLLPKVGDKVTPVGKSAFVADLKGSVGKVVDILHGSCGPIVAVQFPQHPGQTFDLFWKKVRRV